MTCSGNETDLDSDDIYCEVEDDTDKDSDFNPSNVPSDESSSDSENLSGEEKTKKSKYKGYRGGRQTFRVGCVN